MPQPSDMNTALQLPATTLPVGNLAAYRQAVFSLPMLSAEKERELAERYRNEHDLDAAWELVTAHLRFVVRIARGYDGYGLAQADLIQEGNIGLMKAVKRFDPNVGVRLVSFAVHWVRAEIHEFILRNWRIVKVATTKAQRKLFFNLRSSRKRLGWMSRAEVEEVAADLGVEPRVVMEMEQRLGAHDASYDPLVEHDSESDRPTAVRLPPGSAGSNRRPRSKTTTGRPTARRSWPMRWKPWTTAAARSSRGVGLRSERPPCKSLPTSTASPRSGSVSSRRTLSTGSAS